MGEYLGHAVSNGRINFLSVSAVEKGDPRSNGCPKRWAYRYVFGFKELIGEHQQKAMDEGIALHGRIAHFLTTGEQVLETLELKGRHIIPNPGSDLWVEQPFHQKTAAGNLVSSLTAAGIPFVGFIDVGHARGDNKGVPDFEGRDPAGTVELIDWKRKGVAKDRNGDPTYKQPSELVLSVQMAGYGMVVANTQPGTSYVRLSHGYFFAKGPETPRKVTKLHVLDDCARTWQYVEGVARTLVHVAAETDIDRVPGNVRACDMYGGCPYREASPDGTRPACSTYRTNSLDVLYGKLVDDFPGEPPMPLLTQVMQNPPPAPAPQAQPDMRAQLAQEETKLRAQQAVPTPLAIEDAWKRIEGHRRGAPTLGGEAARAMAAIRNINLGQGASFQGSGQLGGIMLERAEHILQLAGELDASNPPAPPPPPTQSYVPGMMLVAPGTPASQPQLAQQHVAALSPGAQPGYGPTPEQQIQGAPNPSHYPSTPETPLAKKRGRPRNDSTTVAATEEVTPSPKLAAPSDPSDREASPTPGATPGAASATGVTSPLVAAVFVDCIPNMPFSTLHEYIDGLNAELSKRYCVGEDGKPSVQDIRCAPKHVAVLSFGAWKGVLAEVVKAHPPAPAVYYLDTRGSELAEVVADTMRVVCGRAGVLFVRGVR